MNSGRQFGFGDFFLMFCIWFFLLQKKILPYKRNTNTVKAVIFKEKYFTLVYM